MKSTLLPPRGSAVLAVLALVGGFAHAQIYRCPNNEYTNDVRNAQAKGCKVVEGGNVTIVRSDGYTPNRSGNTASAPSTRSSSVSPPTVRPATASSVEQRERDADARRILEAELAKAQQKFDEKNRAFNNGLPEKSGEETRNHQKYLDRVAEMKAELNRTQSDIEGLKRELSRLPSTTM